MSESSREEESRADPNGSSPAPGHADSGRPADSLDSAELAKPLEESTPALDAETLERRQTALSQVRRYGDPVLRSPASPVAEFGPQLRSDAERMVAIMRDALGVGLAATQLGVMRRMLVFQAGPDATPTAVVNPEIEWLSEDHLEVADEGCLSLPGIVVEVERPLHVRLSGRDPDGEPLRIEASGLEARVLQHEVDHLDGVLIVDRAEREQRRGALRALREGTSYSPEPSPDDAGAAGDAELKDAGGPQAAREETATAVDGDQLAARAPAGG